MSTKKSNKKQLLEGPKRPAHRPKLKQNEATMRWAIYLPESQYNFVRSKEKPQKFIRQLISREMEGGDCSKIRLLS